MELDRTVMQRLLERRLRRVGRVARMDEGRAAKRGEGSRRRRQGGEDDHECDGRSVKQDLVDGNVDENYWREKAKDRAAWRSIVACLTVNISC